MVRIAHLTDLHLLEPQHGLRKLGERLRLHYLSFFRKLDAHFRRSALERALQRAKAAHFDHLVISGDLTEDGSDAQFEVLAEVLDGAGLAPSDVTLVPGNHDAYADGRAWSRALAGPLRSYANTSSPGAVSEVGDALVVAISTAIHQPLLRASGSIAREQSNTLRDLAARHARDGRAIVVVQHHAPERLRCGAHWIDGLRDYQETIDIFRDTLNLTVLHGHCHYRADKIWPRETHARIFSAPAVVENSESVRIYEVDGRMLIPAS